MRRMMRCGLLVVCLLLLSGCSGTREAATDDRITIRMATWLPTTIEEIVNDFNNAQNEIYIELQTNYAPAENAGAQNNQAATDRMHAEMLAEQPDLYYTVSMDAAKLRNAGLITDWYPLMDADAGFDRSEYQTHIWKLLETDGKLYQLAASFDIFGIGGPAEIYDGLGGFTIDEFQAFLSEYRDRLYIGQERMLKLLLWYGSHMDFINRETLTCEFESEEFLEILEFLNTLPVVPQPGAEVRAARMQGLGIYYNDYMQNGYYTRVAGAPSRYGSGPAVAIGDTFALSATTEHPDACWTFIRWMLSRETQAERYTAGYELPIRIDVWEEALERAQLGGEDERSLFYGYTAGDAQFVEGELVVTYVDGLPEAEAAYLRQLVANVDRIAEGFFDYEDVTKIVEEEILAYLAGDKTAGECAHLIQERAGVLLAEIRN